MRSCSLVDVKTILPNKNQFVYSIIHQYTMCDMIELDNERSAALLCNGLSKVRIEVVQVIRKWFNVKSNDFIATEVEV